MIAWGFAIVIAVIVVVAIRIYSHRAAAQRIAHDARMRAMTQTYISAARKKKAAETAAAAAASAPGVEPTEVVASTVSPGDQRECPFCAEMILKKAKFCKHCRRDVEPVS